MWAWWREMWDKWLPSVCRGEPFGVVMNGDAMDGRHHGSTTQISQVSSDQVDIAEAVWAPVVERCEGRFWLVSGTEAHTGPWAENEEMLAERLAAIPDENGHHARPELWKWVGHQGESTADCGLVHCNHHIGTTSSHAYESSAPMRELVAEFTEAGQWHRRPPDAVARSHRHRYILVEVPTETGRALCVVTPGWQGKTPFTFRIAAGRQSQPQFGAVLLRHGDEEKIYARRFVRSLNRPRPE